VWTVGSSEGPAAVRRTLAARPDRVRVGGWMGNPFGMTEPEDLDLPPITEAMTAPGAARAAEEALRQAAHASWDGVATAADVYSVFGAVGYSLELIPQLLDQLTAWLEKHQDGLDVSATDTSVATRIADVRRDVSAAVETIAAGRAGVASAQAALAPIFGPVESRG
jgi:hypothetical protein